MRTELVTNHLDHSSRDERDPTCILCVPKKVSYLHNDGIGINNVLGEYTLTKEEYDSVNN